MNFDPGRDAGELKEDPLKGIEFMSPKNLRRESKKQHNHLLPYSRSLSLVKEKERCVRAKIHPQNDYYSYSNTETGRFVQFET